MAPHALIIRTAGTNCDRELAHAFELAGAAVVVSHLNILLEDPCQIDRADIIGLPGGFSYGDDIAAGRIFAEQLRHRLIEPLRAAIQRSVPIIGICNGFQVLIKMGLLPNPESGRQQATLAVNTSGRFVARWVPLDVPKETVCVWTKGLSSLQLPIAHGEGRFVPASGERLEQWRLAGQIAIRYGQADNPNGSAGDVAGICDPSGVVLGLMPHPERYTHPTHHPSWTRFGADVLGQVPGGLRIIRNAVEHVRTGMAGRSS